MASKGPKYERAPPGGHELAYRVQQRRGIIAIKQQTWCSSQLFLRLSIWPTKIEPLKRRLLSPQLGSMRGCWRVSLSTPIADKDTGNGRHRTTCVNSSYIYLPTSWVVMPGSERGAQGWCNSGQNGSSLLRNDHFQWNARKFVLWYLCVSCVWHVPMVLELASRH